MRKQIKDIENTFESIDQKVKIILFIYTWKYKKLMVAANQKSTQMHTQKRKRNSNTSLKLFINSQENKRESEVKGPTKANPK